MFSIFNCCKIPANFTTRTLSIRGKDKTMFVVETQFPKSGPYDVVVEVQYAVLTINDSRQYVSGVTYLPGRCFAGIIKEARSNTNYNIGQRVYGWIERGALSEIIITSDKNVAPIPNWMKSHVAATLPYIGWIAYKIFGENNRFMPNQRIHINAEGILNNLLTQLANEFTNNVTGTSDEEDIINEGKEFTIDFYIEALGTKDRICTVAKSGYYLSDISPENLKPLRYNLKDSGEFQKIVQFLNKYTDILQNLSALFVHFKCFDRHFRIIADSMKKQNPTPYILEVKPELFDKFGILNNNLK